MFLSLAAKNADGVEEEIIIKIFIQVQKETHEYLLLLKRFYFIQPAPFLLYFVILLGCFFDGINYLAKLIDTKEFFLDSFSN